MTETEIIERAETLPDRFADRVPESTLWSIKRMRGGGEYGELTIELAASLAYVFGNRVAGSRLDRTYQGKREPDHRTSE